MLRFIISAVFLAAGLPLLVSYSYRQGWIAILPSFLFESTWLVAFITTVLFAYLHRVERPSSFVQLYLLSMAVKLVACFAYALFMIMEDTSGGAANVIYFLLAYVIFTVLEIAFLYRKISRSSGL